MLGRIGIMIEALERAHHWYLANDEPRRAAHVAIWLAFNLASSGKFGPATGWLRRAGTLLKEEETVERGYMLLPVMYQHIFAEEFDSVAAVAGKAMEIGLRFGDPDLIALATHAQGRSHLKLGRIQEGLALLDEVMVSVISGELSPHVTGMVYCSVIEGCYEVQEMKRSRDWTSALSDWCDGQPDLVAFTDQCLAHRAEIHQWEGRWSEALAEASQVHSQNARGPVAAQAWYQRGEIHRLRGDYVEAEDAYRRVGEWGGDPYPGLAQLRLVQGNDEAAAASIRRVLGEATSVFEQARLLPAFVEIMVGYGDLEAAESACRQLSEISAATGIDSHRAAAGWSHGLFEVQSHRPSAALPLLRSALEIWLEMDVPYEAARTRVVLGQALAAVGDLDAASIQFDAARTEFATLGASPDTLVLEALSRGSASMNHGLTQREREVLRLLAKGGSNRSIAGELVLSERTVDRHVSNILTKLGVPSRTAAASYAYENRLL